MTQSYCRLFPATPFRFNLAEITDALNGALAGGDVASLLIRHDDADELEKAARALTPLAQKAGVAVLINEDFELAKSCDADGVEIVGGLEQYRQARAVLGADKIVGGRCGVDRHKAMALGEAGADYVSFASRDADTNDEPESIWWAKVFEVPCVEAGDLTLVTARPFVSQPVDFIRPGEQMWAGYEAAKKAVEDYNAMIGETHIAVD